MRKLAYKFKKKKNNKQTKNSIQEIDNFFLFSIFK